MTTDDLMNDYAMLKSTLDRLGYFSTLSTYI